MDDVLRSKCTECGNRKTDVDEYIVAHGAGSRITDWCPRCETATMHQGIEIDVE